jgi:quercetin 2,3-dioxygenase
MTRNPIAIIPARKAEPAPGLVVDRPFPGPEVDYVDPWLMLDHFGPDRVEPGDTGGLNPHPHRGFETVTLIFDGAMEHHDSSGGHGFIRPGGVQWMTAGAGIVHAEYREKDFVARGGSLHGVQLWLNLPRVNKRATPGYQDLPADVIPAIEGNRSRVRIVAGSHSGVSGPAKTFTPVTLLHVSFAAGGSATIEVPEGYSALAYAVSGAFETGGQRVRARHMALFAPSGGGVELRSDSGAELLVLAGAPIDEPVVSWGPFVMNTRQEIMEAQRDYALGRMGTLPEPA